MKYLIIALLLIGTASADIILITPAQKLHQQVSAQTTAMWVSLANGDKSLFNLIWHNPDKINLSPCQAFAALGTDAVAVRGSHAALVQFMNSIIPGSNTLAEDASFTLTNNQDGSVSCVAPTPTPSPTPTPQPTATATPAP